MGGGAGSRDRGGGGAQAGTSPLTHGCMDGVPSGRVQSGPGCGSSHPGRGSWAKGREGVPRAI